MNTSQMILRVIWRRIRKLEEGRNDMREEEKKCS